MYFCFQANPQPEHLANGIVIGESYRIYAMQKVIQLDSKSTLLVLHVLHDLHDLIYAMQKVIQLDSKSSLLVLHDLHVLHDLIYAMQKVNHLYQRFSTFWYFGYPQI